MIIYLKNGVVIETQDEIESVSKNGLGEIVGIKWSRKSGKSLYYINFPEIAAVVDDTRSVLGVTSAEPPK